MTSSRARELVAQVVARPDDAMRGSDPAVAELVSMGDEAVGAIADAMAGKIERDHHPHDVVEALSHVLSEIASADPAPVLERCDPADPNAMVFVFALGSAPPKPEVIAALGRMVTSENATIRYAAANALVSIRTPEAAAALVPALSDAYAPVQFVAVQAVRDDDTFRVPAAVTPLRRIVADDRIKRTEPQTWEQAREALDDME